MAFSINRDHKYGALLETENDNNGILTKRIESRTNLTNQLGVSVLNDESAIQKELSRNPQFLFFDLKGDVHLSAYEESPYKFVRLSFFERIAHSYGCYRGEANRDTFHAVNKILDDNNKILDVLLSEARKAERSKSLGLRQKEAIIRRFRSIKQERSNLIRGLQSSQYAYNKFLTELSCVTKLFFKIASLFHSCVKSAFDLKQAVSSIPENKLTFDLVKQRVRYEIDDRPKSPPVGVTSIRLKDASRLTPVDIYAYPHESNPNVTIFSLWNRDQIELGQIGFKREEKKLVSYGAYNHTYAGKDNSAIVKVFSNIAKALFYNEPEESSVDSLIIHSNGEGVVYIEDEFTPVLELLDADDIRHKIANGRDSTKSNRPPVEYPDMGSFSVKLTERVKPLHSVIGDYTLPLNK